MIFRTIKNILLTVLFLIFFISIGSIYISLYVIKSHSTEEVEISKGMGVGSIANLLMNRGVIRTPKLFSYYARLTDNDQRLSAGFYEFKKGSTLVDVLEKIASGDVKSFPFQAIEGKRIDDFVNVIAGNQFLGQKVADNFLKLSRSKEFIASLNLGDLPSLEGYLFPDTYMLDKSMSAEDIARIMLERGKAVYSELSRDVRGEAKNYSMKEHIILASIIEKESGNREELPIVASVFYNRLKMGMPLQTDPTVIYGLKNFDGNIRKNDLINPHPYNTYVHRGLPPGAICSPSRFALEAALRPVETDYLYFVSKNDGTHYFSRNLKEHTSAVVEYQIKR